MSLRDFHDIIGTIGLIFDQFFDGVSDIHLHPELAVRHEEVRVLPQPALADDAQDLQAEGGVGEVGEGADTSAPLLPLEEHRGQWSVPGLQGDSLHSTHPGLGMEGCTLECSVQV